MLLQCTTNPSKVPQNALSERIGPLHCSYELTATDYYVDGTKYVFFIETNLTKSKFSAVEKSLENLETLEASEIHRLLNANYFLVAIEKGGRHLHLMRDASGIKTAYYSHADAALCIGSVMHEVAQQQETVAFNKAGVYQLLYSGYLLDGYSFYEGIAEIKMGHHLVFDEHLQLVKSTQHLVHLAQQDNTYSEEENCLMLREAIQKAHQPFLSDKNIVLLSGGLDSIAMIISLDDIVKGEKLDSISFKVKDTTQDESVYSTSIAQHLQVPNKLIEVDANDPGIIHQFEEKVLRMNNPYYGAWIFGHFSGTPEEMYYAGQDTRLHTPALNEVDKWAYSFLKYQESWWLKGFLLPLTNGIVIPLLKALGWDKSPNRIVKNLFKAAHIFDLKKYISTFYFKIDAQKIKEKGLPIDYYHLIAEHLDLKLENCPSKRALYNEIVRLKWSEQYIYDMRYLQDVARINQTYIAMPFYNKELAEFSSGIPFDLATKPMIGRARFGKKKNIIYKYVLRKAFRDKLNDLTYYRAKAVSMTLHQLFNGPLGEKVGAILAADLAAKQSFIKEFQLEVVVKKYINHKKWAFEDSDYLHLVYYIATLIIYHQAIVLASRKTRVEKVPDWS
ncbi:MAG: asparagine synthase-related protein [Saprospiraceae bacterium]